MSRIITLTTDFGINDAYVAIMKGVIWGINPDVRLMDISHTITPQNIFEAAFVISTAYKYFPKGTIHIVVVDPGVGTRRRGIILETPDALFVAPDNGVLTYILREYCENPTPSRGSQEITLPSDVLVVSITEPRFWRNPASPTFHGRDVFAPVAAYLSKGLPPEEFGEMGVSAVQLPVPQPERANDGAIIGHVIHIDRFGNIITDIKGDELPQLEIDCEISGATISGLSRTYAEKSGLLALIDSFGYLEISLKNSSAASLLKAAVGSPVKVSFP